MSSSNFDEYLRTFFDTQIHFLSSRELQQKAWSNAYGEKFGVCLVIYFESWSVIEDHQSKFKISQYTYLRLKKLYDMIEAFQATIDYPTTPKQYAALLTNSKWREVQQFAHLIYVNNSAITTGR